MSNSFFKPQPTSILGAFSAMATGTNQVFTATVVDLQDNDTFQAEIAERRKQILLTVVSRAYPNTQSYIDSLFSEEHKLSPLGVAFQGSVITIKAPDSAGNQTPILTNQDNFGQFTIENIIQPQTDMIALIPEGLAQHLELQASEAINAQIGLAFQSEHNLDFRPVMVATPSTP